MALSSAQLTALKADIAANTATVPYAGSTQIKDVPNTDDGNIAIATWYSALASPSYWVWASNVTRSQLYNTTSDLATNWDWTTYRGQSVTEQGAWREMFMGDAVNFGQANIRAGIGKIFTGSAPQNAQRDHCLAVGRRVARRIEKLFAVVVSSPPANTGNNSGDARGATTNPDVMGYEGTINLNDVAAARAS